METCMFDELQRANRAGTCKHGSAHNSSVRSASVQSLYKSVEPLSVWRTIDIDRHRKEPYGETSYWVVIDSEYSRDRLTANNTLFHARLIVLRAWPPLPTPKQSLLYFIIRLCSFCYSHLPRCIIFGRFLFFFNHFFKLTLITKFSQ